MSDKPAKKAKKQKPEENISEKTAAAEIVPAAETTPAGEPAKKGRRKWPWVIAAAVIIIIIGYVPFYYTNSAEACAKCHSMKPYYDSWKKSWHGKNDTRCDQCHVKPGAFAYYSYRLMFYREIYAEIFKKDLAPWGATSPGESSCTRAMCHSFNRLSSTSGDIKVDHEAHSNKAKKKCSYCHAGASHTGIKGLGLELPPRKQCFECHKDKAKNCNFCHTIKYKEGTVPKTPHY